MIATFNRIMFSTATAATKDNWFKSSRGVALAAMMAEPTAAETSDIRAINYSRSW